MRDAEDQSPVAGHGPQTEAEVAEAIADFRASFDALRTEIGRAVVGQRAIVDEVLVCLFAGGHALLEGVPGIGKTLLVRSLAKALRLDFGRIQFTPDLMPADIIGSTVVNEVEREGGGRERVFAFEAGPIFAQMVLADEINRATPKTQSALLEAMQERSVTTQGQTRGLPAPFFVMATQNPLEQEGTYPLPEAQLDRFLFKLHVGYATRDDLHEILARTTGKAGDEPEPVLDGDRVLAHQALVRRVIAVPHVVDYAVRLTLSTHPSGRDSDGRFATPMVNDFVRVGASPRAAQALLLGAKVWAMLDGRAAAAVEDVRKVAAPALRHRLILNFEGAAEGVTADDIVANAIETLPIESPR